MCRSQGPRRLRYRLVAARLLGLRVRIPPEAWMFVSCKCYILQIDVSATGRSLAQGNSTECARVMCGKVKPSARAVGG
jgi:hypothetical protein